MSTENGSMHEWYRFLDARSDDEAACALTRHSAQLDEVLTALEHVSRGLYYAPGGDVDQALRVSASTLGEAIEMLNDVLRRFRAGEHQIA